MVRSSRRGASGCPAPKSYAKKASSQTANADLLTQPPHVWPPGLTTEPSVRVPWRWPGAGTSTSLLGAERHDRIEAASPAGRRNAKEDADTDRNACGEHRRPPRDHGRHRRIIANRPGRGGTDADAYQPAEGRQKHGFDEELQQDVTLPGAERFTQADLRGPLTHRYQHDVGDTHPADQQGDRRDGGEDEGEHAKDPPDGPKDLGLSDR